MFFILKSETICYLVGEDGLGLGSGVDTTGLDRDDEVTASLQEMMRVEGNDTGLIWLGNIGKDAVNHADQHSVLPWVASVLDNWD